MKTIEEIFNLLKSKFGNSVIEIITIPHDSYISINPMEIDKVCKYLKDENELQFDSLMNLSGVDDSNGESKNDDSGTAIITGGTLSVYYHIESTVLRHKLTLRVATPRENPEAVSVEEIWKCADWHEREVFDLFGIKFLNHPDLRRILMPYDWEAGYPLRKDYKNPEFYQGMKVPY